MKSDLCFALLGLAATAMALTVSANAASVRTDVGFTTNTLAANDDGSTGAVAIGFNANFFGTTYSQLYVNNNGNVTFNGPLSTFTPFDLVTTGTPIIAPFFSDVDTRGAGSTPVQYGSSTVNGHDAFGVNWVNVGQFSQNDAFLHSFQLVLIDRADTGTGNFDFEFNYDTITWDRNNARAGYSNGSSASYEIPGSGGGGAFLDGGNNSLAGTGQYVFQVRNGSVTPQPPTRNVPDGGSTLACLGLAVGALGIARRKFSKN